MAVIASACSESSGPDIQTAGGQFDGRADTEELEKLAARGLYDFDEDAASGVECTKAPEALPHEEVEPGPPGIVGLESVRTWVETNDVIVTGSDQATTYVSLDQTESSIISGPDPSTDLRTLSSIPLLLARRSHSSPVYLGITERGLIGHLVVRSGEDLIYVDTCQSMSTIREVVSTYVSKSAVFTSETEVWSSLIGLDGAAKVTGLGRDLVNTYIEGITPPTWAEQDPATRVIDPERFPNAGLQLREVFVRIEVPELWRATTDTVLCSHTVGIGWNECAALDMTDEYERTGGFLDLLAFVDPSGESVLELALLGRDGRTDGPSFVIGTVEASAEALQDNTVEAGRVLSAALPGDLLKGNGTASLTPMS